MDPRGSGPPPSFPHNPFGGGASASASQAAPAVRRQLSAEFHPFAPAAAAAAVITTARPLPPPAPPTAARRVAPPAPPLQPYPQAKPDIVLPAMVPRLTTLLPLHELNIFLQASRRHLAAMELTGALKGLALRHPRDSAAPTPPGTKAHNANANAQGQGGSPEKEAPQATTSTGCTPPPLKVLARFRRGLTTLRLADRRVLPYLFLGVHQRLAAGIVTLVLRDLHMADEDLIRLSVLLGKPRLLPALQELVLGGRNRFGDQALAAFATLGLNPGTSPASINAPPEAGGVGTTAAVGQQQHKVDPPAMKLYTLDLGVNGLTASGQALEALAEAFEARSALLLPPAPTDSNDEGEANEEAKAGKPAAGGGVKGHGVVGLRKLVLGQWCWGPRPALLAPSPNDPTEEEAKNADAAASASIPALHPLRRLLAAPAVAGTLEELDLLQAHLLPGEIEALALALRDGAAAGSYRRLRVLRLGLDPDAFAAAAKSVSPINEDDEGPKQSTPPKQQEEQQQPGRAATTTTPSGNSNAPLLPLLACLRDGACPRLATLDIDARVPPAKPSTPNTTSSDTQSAVVSPYSPLVGDPLAALATGLRQGTLRRLEGVRLARCGLGASDLYQLLEAVHAAALAATSTAPSTSKAGGGKKKGSGVVGLRELSLEGNPALGAFGVQVLAMCIREGTLPQLQALNLDGAGGGDTGLRELTMAFESLTTGQKPLPLHTLALAGNQVTTEGVAWLGRALTAGALPRLATLSLANNPGIGEEGSQYLTSFFIHSPPAPCKLKSLDLRWTEMGVAGAEALAAVIEAGACPALERLSLAQGPRTPWSLERRTALHKVRDALLTRANPSLAATAAHATTNPDGAPVSAYVARRRAGAVRRRAAAGNGPRVTCL